jgi:hypothetical protein
MRFEAMACWRMSPSLKPEAHAGQVRVMEEYLGRVQGLLISLAGTLVMCRCQSPPVICASCRLSHPHPRITTDANEEHF